MNVASPAPAAPPPLYGQPLWIGLNDLLDEVHNSTSGAAWHWGSVGGFISSDLLVAGTEFVPGPRRELSWLEASPDPSFSSDPLSSPDPLGGGTDSGTDMGRTNSDDRGGESERPHHHPYDSLHTILSEGDTVARLPLPPTLTPHPH